MSEVQEAPVAAILANLEAYEVVEKALDLEKETDRESWKAQVRMQAEVDLYFLMRCVLLNTGGSHQTFPDGKRYIEHPFAYKMAREVQFDYEDVMLMAARGHGKSTTVTFALVLWLYIKNPTWTFCIFSVTRQLAKDHLTEIRDELEQNELLHELWPDRFWEDKAARRAGGRSWSKDEGLAMPLLPPGKEKTFEGWGLVDDASPTGKHFKSLVYDDVVDERNAGSPEMIAKARAAYDRSGGFESPGGCIRTHVGTPYADNDPGVALVKEGVVRLRCRPAVDPSRQDTPLRKRLGGRPVFMTEKELEKRRIRMKGEYAIQMLMDAHKGQRGTLNAAEDIRYYQRLPHEVRPGQNVYICVDPNGGFRQSKHNDQMALTVWGLGGDHNFYLLDAWMGHMNPAERQALIIQKQAEWAPVMDVRIEEKTSGVESFWLQQAQDRMNHRFDVTSISPQSMKAGAGVKGHYNRMDRLTDAWQPLLSAHRLYLPERLDVHIDGEVVDLAKAFYEELRRFPIAESDDLISSGALLFSDHGGKRGALPLVWPSASSSASRFPYQHQTPPGPDAWMGVG